MIRFLCLIVVCWIAMGEAVRADESPNVESNGVDVAASQSTDTPPPAPTLVTVDDQQEQPWDYSPYRVLIWLVATDPSVTVNALDQRLREYLDRDFAAIWRIDFEQAPPAVAAAAVREMGGLTYDRITAADPILAIKRDHPDAVRIRVARNVATYVKKVYGTADGISQVKRLAGEDATIAGVAERFVQFDGDAIALRQLWDDDETEGLLVPRGVAQLLTEPAAKLIKLPVSGLVADAVTQYDKIFVVRVNTDVAPFQVDAVEMETLMHHFGPVASMPAATHRQLPAAMGKCVTEAFAPVVRIDNAGQKSAVGLLRAGGLIVDEQSPAAIHVDDVLEPMVRKNDRNGRPIIIGPMDWAFLMVKEFEGRRTKMDFYAGRAGGLQGRKNSRTFRTALKVRPFHDESLLRLHLKRDPNFPLIGYEIYEKDLESGNMSFVGRTDWDGRLRIEKTKDPFRLLYVKNGGAVLARLPIVPGLHEMDVADLSGDDMRLQAEAYIRGVQNAIIDLVAIRELFRARIHLRLERGELDKAEALLLALREQPSNEELANEMAKRQTDYLKLLGNGDANQRRKIDEMFTTTRNLLTTHINPRMINELEELMIQVRKNGGKLPTKTRDRNDANLGTEEASSAEPPATDT